VPKNAKGGVNEFPGTWGNGCDSLLTRLPFPTRTILLNDPGVGSAEQGGGRATYMGSKEFLGARYRSQGQKKRAKRPEKNRYGVQFNLSKEGAMEEGNGDEEEGKGMKRQRHDTGGELLATGRITTGAVAKRRMKAQILLFR